MRAAYPKSKEWQQLSQRILKLRLSRQQSIKSARIDRQAMQEPKVLVRVVRRAGSSLHKPGATRNFWCAKEPNKKRKKLWVSTLPEKLRVPVPRSRRLMYQQEARRASQMQQMRITYLQILPLAWDCSPNRERRREQIADSNFQRTHPSNHPESAQYQIWKEYKGQFWSV